MAQEHVKTLPVAPKPVRFVPAFGGGAQNYLYEKYGLRKVTDHTQRIWIKQGKFPQPIEISPSNKAYEEQQLDDYVLALRAQSSKAKD